MEERQNMNVQLKDQLQVYGAMERVFRMLGEAKRCGQILEMSVEIVQDPTVVPSENIPLRAEPEQASPQEPYDLAHGVATLEADLSAISLRAAQLVKDLELLTREIRKVRNAVNISVEEVS